MMQKGFSPIITLVIFFIIILSAIGGYYYGTQQESKTTQSAREEFQQLVEPSKKLNKISLSEPSPNTIYIVKEDLNKSQEIKYYSNPKLELSFQFPGDWGYTEFSTEQLETYDAYGVKREQTSLSFGYISNKDVTGQDVPTYITNQLGVLVTSGDDISKLDLEAFGEAKMGGSTIQPLYWESVKYGEIAGREVLWGCQSGCATTIFRKGNTIYLFNWSNYEPDIMEEILSSLKFN